MKTIRGKIIAFFILCLAFAALLAGLYYQNAFSLRRKIYAIERFDDLLNDVLELRRYEKNILLYKDADSLLDGMAYLDKLDRDYDNLKDEIDDILGPDAGSMFGNDLHRYKQILSAMVSGAQQRTGPAQEEALRAEGKGLAQFTQRLIQKKRHRIDLALQRVLTIPLISIALLVILALVIFRFVNTGILKPLLLVEKATDHVAKQTFRPIHYDTARHDEITRLMASFNKMVAELDSRQDQLIQSRKLAAIGTLTSGIAHELNNPLNNISITAEAFMLNYAEMSPGDIKETVDDILTQTDRASQVVKNLLEFSRAERPGLRLLDLKEVIERTLKLIRNQLIVAHVRIETAIASEIPVIRGKAQDLQQAFVNILLNAIQAMPGGGVIIIQAGPGPAGFVRVDLSDSGTGIKPESMEQIFDPFYTTKASGQGTGLGLSIVYNIIRTHGGYMEVNSVVDRGTTFSIYLPAITDTDKEEMNDDPQGSCC